MKKLTISLIFCCFLSFLFFTSCNKREREENLIKNEKLTRFSLKQFSQNYSFTLMGESAEVLQNENTSIMNPSFSLKTESEIIEIKTDKEGKGEIKIDQKNKKIKEVIITGKVLIIYRDIKSEKINMEVTCEKVSYIDQKREMIFEGSPLIKRGKNKFSGEKIIYNIDNDTIEIKGNVNVEIIPEEKSNK
ncbi:MAG: hypothetical protein N2589_07310 [bacterium]|nr:hypothetical protein [bacterium]MCX7917909.1 hypothetical protein [bacterium]MDW8164332.1 LptA/OstA family protein [Candidatus Omnitrophota bacterium]